MIKTTSNYNIFSLMEENRNIDLSHRKTKNLAESMLEYGWLSAFPLMAKKDGGRLIVVDGQHRLSVAREYGLPVKYVIEEQLIDVARLNDTSRGWTAMDFAQKFAKSGHDDYAELLQFFESNEIPFTMCAAILSGRENFGGGLVKKFYEGGYKVKARVMAFALSECYSKLIHVAPQLKKLSTVKALWSCFHVDYFDPDRLVDSASKRSTSIGRPVNTDVCLDILQETYNFAKRDKKPLKFDAIARAKDRNPTIAKSK